MSCTDDGVLDIKDLTGGDQFGSGDFDELMRAVKAHVEEQYDCDRITGSNYSQIYLGALQAVLQTSSQYAVEAPKATQAILLMKQQILSEIENTKLIAAQIENVNADTDIKVKQLDVMDKDMEHTDAQIRLSDANTANVQEQTKLVTCNIEKTGAETLNIRENTKLTTCQIEKTGEEIELIKSNKLNVDADTEVKQVTKLQIEAETIKTGVETDLVRENILKTTAEISNIEANTIKTAAETLNVEANTRLTDANTEKVTDERESIQQGIELSKKQMEKIDSEMLIDAETVKKIIADTSMVGTQEDLVDEQIIHEGAKKILTDCNAELTGAKTDESVCSLEVMQSNMDVNEAQISKMGVEEDQIQQNIQNLIAQETLTRCQSSKTAAETTLTLKKVDETACNMVLIACNAALAGANRQVADANVTKINKEVQVMDKNMELTDSQISLNREQELKMAQEVRLMEAKVLTEAENRIVMQCEQLVKGCQAALIAQKRVSECAQTNTTFPGSDMIQTGTYGSGELKYTRGGVLGAQHALYAKQKESFDRDAVIKMAKIASDVSSVHLNNTEDADAAANNVGFDIDCRETAITRALTATNC